MISAAEPAGTVLAVDLDGTLIRTDLLHENFWAAVARDPLVPLRAAVVLASQGRSGLKGWLAGRWAFDPTLIPQTAAVIEAIRLWREQGGRTALVTAADQRLADTIASHIGLFDEVHGTRPGHNLKGAAKARFLVQRYGKGGFAYIGDSVADLRVWPHASLAVTVGASPELRRRVAALGVPVEHLEAPQARPGELARLVLEGGWLAALVGIAALVTAGGGAGAMAMFALALLWLSFGAVGTGAAVMHDLLRLQNLRKTGDDPGPIAAGRIEMPRASALALGLPLAGLVIGGLTGGLVAAFCLVLAGAARVLVGPRRGLLPSLGLGVAWAALAGLAAQALI